jgi:hypothetical protein
MSFQSFVVKKRCTLLPELMNSLLTIIQLLHFLSARGRGSPISLSWASRLVIKDFSLHPLFVNQRESLVLQACDA